MMKLLSILLYEYILYFAWADQREQGAVWKIKYSYVENTVYSYVENTVYSYANNLVVL